MSETSAIEWTDATWNPVRARALATGRVGWFCAHASEGCRNCYAEGFNARLGTQVDYKPQLLGRDVEVFLDEKTLTAPLRWKKPRRIFAGSMSDLFGEFVTDEMIDRIFAVMALAPRHTFQVLTKRSARMRAYVNELVDEPSQSTARRLAIAWPGRTPTPTFIEFPLPNVWLGVSAEDQARADERIPDLLATPAAARFLSAEPLLGPIDLGAIKRFPIGGEYIDASRGTAWTDQSGLPNSDPRWDRPGLPLQGCRGLDWVIAGGESGAGARPMHPDWARQLRDQCAAAGVPFFFKQWGEWIEVDDGRGPDTHRVIEVPEDYDDEARALIEACERPAWVSKDGRLYPSLADIPIDVPCRLIDRLGKKAAGRLLDGVQHDAMPGDAA